MSKSKIADLQVLKGDLIEIACRMSQEMRDIIEDSIESGSPLPGTEELLNEWNAKYKQYAKNGGV